VRKGYQHYCSCSESRPRHPRSNYSPESNQSTRYLNRTLAADGDSRLVRRKRYSYYYNSHHCSYFHYSYLCTSLPPQTHPAWELLSRVSSPELRKFSTRNPTSICFADSAGLSLVGGGVSSWDSRIEASKEELIAADPIGADPIEADRIEVGRGRRWWWDCWCY
jgi:hypothetical protein